LEWDGREMTNRILEGCHRGWKFGAAEIWIFTEILAMARRILLIESAIEVASRGEIAGARVIRSSLFKG
jgi:hypothetical protein